jgi:uncharacterized protein YyaL (SSP411 family)
MTLKRLLWIISFPIYALIMQDNHSQHKANQPNELIHELSPYLLQHAWNPVQWQPWGDKAFEQARLENKPLFISIGYATCHWCHVMERESFENEEIASILNKWFIPIKVDREERPDIDAACMEVCQAMTGHGGWPLSMFMTPEKLPFFTGTYFPPESRSTRPGFREILLRIASAWQEDQQNIIKGGRSIASAVLAHNTSNSSAALPKDILHTAYQSFQSRFDQEYGGFGKNPKFPCAHHHLFLLRYAAQHGQKPDMTELTLKAMINGGIHDHIGYGFHRYSTDEQWLLPHFEKMLYDQAMLLRLYTEAWQATGQEIYKSTAAKIVEYVQECLLSAEGGFWSAEDADSEGHEGLFYIWKYSELEQILTEEEFIWAKEYYNIRPEGNFRDESTGLYNGQNILHCDITSKGSAEQYESAIRNKLHNVRSKRIRPLLDDKILTDWNALMAGALAYAGRVFQEKSWTQMAVSCVQFLYANMYKPQEGEQGGLLHRYRQGKAAVQGMLDDYAFLAEALLEIHQADGDLFYLEWCANLCRDILAIFYGEKENQAYLLHAASQPTPFYSNAQGYDGAIPSGASATAMILARMGHICGRPDWSKSAEDIIEAYSKQISQHPTGFAYMLAAYQFIHQQKTELILAGAPGNTHTFLPVTASVYRPGMVIIHNTDPQKLSSIAPYLAIQWQEGHTIAFLCHNGTCNLPALTAEELQRQLSL